MSLSPPPGGNLERGKTPCNRGLNTGRRLALGGLLGGQLQTLFRTEEAAPSKRDVKALRLGRTARVDDEYEGNGTANLFTLFAPLEGWLIPDKQTLIEEIAAWQQEHNANHTKADSHFTADDARIKLNRPRASRAKPAVEPLPRGRPAKGSKP